ncbi:MAG: MogA/MoaB family molybdenum cofactor biosynthesis protein [Candidatus Edwardsbacteria bacterium]|nr:MogA/MoaB family molybdenum cofactor biosynthesis protein [Candidatus Edwardsbacteria bacterium]
MRIAVLTVSDKGSRGQRRDTAGPAIRELLQGFSPEVAAAEIVPDERAAIAAKLKNYADELHCDLVFTTGGTGFSPRDVTPEATLEVIERSVPGIPEAIRAGGMAQTPKAMLSRAVAGIRGKTLIINLSGSEKAVREQLAVILPVLGHAVETARGEGGECGR